MGCGTSMDEPPNELAMLNVEQGAELLDNFLRLQKEIWNEEKHPPIPTLGHIAVVLEKIGMKLEAALMVFGGDRDIVPGSVPPMEDEQPILLSPEPNQQDGYEVWDEQILKVMQGLNLAGRPDAALEHEEFIANLTRNHQKLLWLRERKQEAEEELARQSERVQYLQALYHQQESIIGGVTGRPSPRSMLEREVERVVSYRDTLYRGLLSWAESYRLAGAGAVLAAKGATSWQSLAGVQAKLQEAFSGANSASHCLYEATLCLTAAQAALPGVQFTYCTAREIAAINQVLEYLYTDLHIPDRYNHAIKVYTSFQKRAKALQKWVQQTMKETIQKDVQEVEQKISKMATMLSNERSECIRQAAGLMNIVEPVEYGMGMMIGQEFGGNFQPDPQPDDNFGGERPLTTNIYKIKPPSK